MKLALESLKDEQYLSSILKDEQVTLATKFSLVFQ